MARMERANKRLWIIVIILIAAFIATNAGWIYYESQFQVVETSIEAKQDGGGSYARGRGRNARRDSMGRYSREGGYSQAADDMIQDLRELMEDAPDERTQQEFQRFIQKMEQM